MEFTISEDDKQTLRGTAELLWKKGAHHPQEAALAFKFTQFVERVLAPEVSERPVLPAQAEAKK